MKTPAENAISPVRNRAKGLGRRTGKTSSSVRGARGFDMLSASLGWS
jgi:hypothetical protein